MNSKKLSCGGRAGPGCQCALSWRAASTAAYCVFATTPTNLRATAIFNGQLYVSSATGTFQGISTVGTGLPTTMLRVCWTMGALETIAGRMFASMLVPAVLGADPLVQLIHVDDVVDAARLAAHAVCDGTFNVAGDGVLPLSTVIKLVGRLRAAAPESAVRAALDALWVAGIGNVPGAHTTYLRDTFVADTSRALDLLGFRARYAIRDAIGHHVAARGGGAGRAA